MSVLFKAQKLLVLLTVRLVVEKHLLWWVLQTVQTPVCTYWQPTTSAPYFNRIQRWLCIFLFTKSTVGSCTICSTIGNWCTAERIINRKLILWGSLRFKLLMWNRLCKWLAMGCSRGRVGLPELMLTVPDLMQFCSFS